jgi:catechol 2,3-dioxygenase-like lactoylglutathione lyase family enzyme
MEDQPLLAFYSTVVRVRDLQQSQRWYESVLGFIVTFRDPHYLLRVMSDVKGHLITIWQMDNDSAPVTAQRNGSYLVFVTPDVEQARRELIRRGGTPESIEAHPGLRLFWLQDPDGHRHSIMQFMPE